MVLIQLCPSLFAWIRGVQVKMTIRW